MVVQQMSQNSSLRKKGVDKKQLRLRFDIEECKGQISYKYLMKSLQSDICRQLLDQSIGLSIAPIHYFRKLENKIVESKQVPQQLDYDSLFSLIKEVTNDNLIIEKLENKMNTLMQSEEIQNDAFDEQQQTVNDDRQLLKSSYSCKSIYRINQNNKNEDEWGLLAKAIALQEEQDNQQKLYQKQVQIQNFRKVLDEQVALKQNIKLQEQASKPQDLIYAKQAAELEINEKVQKVQKQKDDQFQRRQVVNEQLKWNQEKIQKEKEYDCKQDQIMAKKLESELMNEQEKKQQKAIQVNRYYQELDDVRDLKRGLLIENYQVRKNYIKQTETQQQSLQSMLELQREQEKEKRKPVVNRSLDYQNQFLMAQKNIQKESLQLNNSQMIQLFQQNEQKAQREEQLKVLKKKQERDDLQKKLNEQISFKKLSKLYDIRDDQVQAVIQNRDMKNFDLKNNDNKQKKKEDAVRVQNEQLKQIEQKQEEKIKLKVMDEKEAFINKRQLKEIAKSHSQLLDKKQIVLPKLK